MTVTNAGNDPVRRAANPRNPLNGHHAISLGLGQSNLVTRFSIAVRFMHDV